MTCFAYLVKIPGPILFSLSLPKAASIFLIAPWRKLKKLLRHLQCKAPKLSNCSFVKAGKGYSIKRGEQYDYRHLAFTFRNKKADPFLVTVMPEKTPNLHSHEGQEFQYLLEGEAEVRIGDATYVMHPGDSLYINSSTPHALTALNGEPATFLAVVMK